MYNNFRGDHFVHNIDIYIGIIMYGLRAYGDKPLSPSRLSQEKWKIVHDLFLLYLIKLS